MNISEDSYTYNMKNEKSVNQDLELANLGDVDVQIKLEPTPSDLSNDSDLRLINKARGNSQMSFLQTVLSWFSSTDDQGSRKVYLYGYSNESYKRVKNVVKNQKYNAFTFVPVVLFNQFKFFFNFFYLIIALSQFIPVLKVGFLFTYIGPLALVLFLTMLKEGYDDFQRYKRDKEANSSIYQ